MNQSVKKINNGILLFILPIVCILGLSLYYIENNIMIKIVGDEYGYWAAGAYLSGLDWTELTSHNSYFSYGYSLFLALILKLNLSSISSYQLAIVLNAFFLCGIYVIVFKLVQRILSNKEYTKMFCMCVALPVTLYTGNLYYTQFTVTEVLLSFIYWLIIYLAYELLYHPTFLKNIFFIFLAIYSFSVHQRAIGICVTCACFWIYVAHRNRKKALFWLGSIAFGILLLAAVFFVKGMYQSAYFTDSSNIHLTNNDFAGQIGKVQYLFTISGLWMFIKAYVGKIFYACSSTYLLVGVAVLLTIKKLIISFINYKKTRKNIDNLLILSTFIVCNTLIMISVGSLFMINYYGRIDLLIYGRYFEFTLSPLIMLGLIYIFCNSKIDRKSIYMFFAYIILYFVITLLVNYILNYSSTSTNVFYNCAGIANTLIENEYAQNSLLIISIKKIAVFLMLVIVAYSNKNKIKIISMLILSVLFIYISQNVYVNGCLNWSIKQSEEEVNLAKKIFDLDAQDSLYYYIKENYLKADYLQFLLKDSSIHCFEKAADIETLSNEDYILTIFDTELEESLLQNNYQAVAESINLKLWEKQ